MLLGTADPNKNVTLVFAQFIFRTNHRLQAPFNMILKLTGNGLLSKLVVTHQNRAAEEELR